MDPAFPQVLRVLIPGLGLRPPQIHMLESSPPVPRDVVMIGEKVFTRVIKLKWGHEGGP